MPKKKFIEKKNAVTFYLAHRSQKDPLIADETAPQHVLVPMNQAGGDSAVAGPSKKKEDGKDPAKRKEEQQKYGIYFDDEYDYLQHLRDSKEVSHIEWDVVERVYATDIKPPVELPKKADLKDFKLKLPSSVFESEYVEDIGLLNKAAPHHGPRPDLDPDVVAALEDDFDFDNPENELEDNFMDLAGIPDEAESADRELTKEDIEGLFSDEDEEGEGMEEGEESDDDTIGSMDGPNYNMSEAGDENRSNFTSYSMSSSVVRRNEQLTLLDERFEKMFGEYEETEIGPLDCDEIEGHLDPQSDLLMRYAEEYAANKAKEDTLNQKILEMAVKSDDSSDTHSDDDSTDSDDGGKRWDCESILSTYSNTKNRPKVIREPSKRNMIKVSEKTGMPVGVLGSGLTQGNLKELNNAYAAEHPEASQDVKSVASMASSIWLPRPKVETPEERMERKKRVKEYKKERRVERKANSEAFKEEKKRQIKVRLNCKANVAGLKL